MMKFKNILILEETGCDASKCDGSWTTITAVQYDSYKSDPTLQACFTPSPSTYKYCKLKKKVDPPPVDNSKNCIQPTECPPNLEDFLTWYWKDKNWVDSSGNPDTKSWTDEINGVELNAKKCVIKKYSNTYEGAKKKYTGKCKAGASGTEGLKIAYANSKEKYTSTPNIVTVDPDAKAREECKSKGGVFNDQTKECKMPLNPAVQDFRIDFDTQFGGLVDKFRLDSDQWNRMYDTMPETYPPTSFSVLSSITKNIVSFIEDFYASSEFGIFKQILDAFVELYSNKENENGEVIEDKSKILDPSFFKRFGGTVEQVKQLSKSLETVSNEKITKLNYNPLMNPETLYQNMFSEKIVTVLSTPESYFTKPLKMYAWKKNVFGALPKIDLTPIDNVLKSEITDVNCVNLLDTYGNYKSNPLVPREKIEEMVTMGQQCLCKNKFLQIGILVGKDKFNREKKELIKKRLGILNNMGVSKLNC